MEAHLDFVPIKSVGIATRTGDTGPIEVVGLAEDRILVADLDDVDEGDRVRITFRIPLRHRDVAVDARATGETRGEGTASSPTLVVLALVDPPASPRLDIGRVVEQYLTPPEPQDHSDDIASEIGFVPRIANRYDLTEPLRSDELFLNFRGTDRLSGESVLLRLLKAERRRDEDWLERFREAHLAATRVRHPHVLRILGAVSTESREVVVCEMGTGPRLTTYVDNRGPLPVAQAIRLLAQSMDALGAIHAQGLTYGTLHPGRVRITPGDNVCLADLGTALVSPETAIGPGDSPCAFMAPEVRHGSSADGRSEVYSLGMLLYMLLLGEIPFAPGELARLASAPTLSPTPPAARSDRVPRELGTVISRAISLAPGDRHASVVELTEALAPLARASTGPSIHRKRALVIVRDAEERHLLGSVLKTAGHHVVEAESGMRGLELAFAEPFDLVCIDLGLRGMDGFEVCMAFKSDSRTSKVPILVLSDVPESEARPLVESLGVHHVVAQPVAVKSFREHVRKLLAS